MLWQTLRGQIDYLIDELPFRLSPISTRIETRTTRKGENLLNLTRTNKHQTPYAQKTIRYKKTCLTALGSNFNFKELVHEVN